MCVATLDGRTSPYCIDIDGKHFKYSEMKEEENYPPFHPNCRCTTRGYINKEAEKNIKRRARNPVTEEEELVPNMTYKEWYESLFNRHGKLKVDTSIKAIKNRTNDQKQFEDYKKYVGKDIKNIEIFKDIKYNNPKKWDNVKSYVNLSKKGEIPSSLNFNKYYDNMQNNNWEAVDFSPKRIDIHISKHLSEFGDITKEEYVDNTRKLLNNETNENILGFTNENGFVFRYDKNKMSLQHLNLVE